MKQTPLISIIIPTYNHAHFLVHAIQSVLDQKYDNLEILVIDNHSLDGTDGVVLGFQDDRIKLLKIHNDGVIAASRNMGINQAKGEYVAFLDSDDIWEKNKLITQVAHMIDNNLNFVSTNSYNINESSENINSQYKLSRLLDKMRAKSTLGDLIKHNFIVTSSVVIKKDILLNFNESVDLVAVEDFSLWLEIFNKKDTKYGYVNEQLLAYRVVSNSMSERGNLKQVVKSNLCILKFILNHDKYAYFKQYSIRIIWMFAINFFRKMIGFFMK